MSRCFPFPPPGYEKKARADEENLLNKEKQKEKKHKKEKKDGGNREGKEKKEKERSEEKHKEKKERKDKHKDKKDKHKDKERKSISVEKNTARPPELGIAEQLGPFPVQSAQTNDTNFLLELGKRINNNDERSAEKNLLVHKFTLTGQGNHEMPSKDKKEDRRKVNGRPNGVVAANSFIQNFKGVHQISNNDERSAEKNLLVHDFTLTGQGNHEMPSKDKKEDQRKVNGRQNGVVAANGFIQKFEGVHRRTLEEVGELVEKSVKKRTEQEENNKHNNGEIGGGEQKERYPGKKIGVGLLAEKPIEKGAEQEESNKQKNGESRAGKHKERDPEKKRKSKDKKRGKEKEKEERRKEKKKEKERKKEQLKQRENGKPAVDEGTMKTALDLKERSGGEGNVGKRKELETNEFLHDTGIRPSKLLRPISSTHQIMENGRMTEPFKPAFGFVEDLKGNIKISSSPSVPVNGRILEPSPKTVSSTHQIMVNGRKPEPSKTAIRIVAEFGDGNKKVTTSFSVAGNGKIMEPCPGRNPVSSTQEIVENGTAEGEGSKKLVSSIFVTETRSKMEPPTPALPDPENGRKTDLSRSIDQSTSGAKLVFINPKVGSKETMVNSKDEPQQPSFSLKRPYPLENVKETMVNGKDEAQQPSVSLKRPSPSLENVKETMINGKIEGQQSSVSLKRPSHSSKKVKPKPPHPDSKFLDSIFSVPKVEWSDFVDQDEWLFGSLPPAKRSKMGSSQVEGTTPKQVWAEAIRLESADVVALPYVIPY